MEINRKNIVLICFYLTSLCVVQQAVNTVKQSVIVIAEEEKRAFMQYFIDSMKPKDKVIIFVGRKIMYVIFSQYFICSFFLTETLDNFFVHITNTKCNSCCQQCDGGSSIFSLFIHSSRQIGSLYPF